MKRVSFEVAKAIKEAGYPQGWKCDKHYCLESEGEYGYQIGDLVSANAIHKNCLEAISAPTYLEVWLWLWRNKGIEILPTGGIIYHGGKLGTKNLYNYPNDPEESIVAAIDCLVENNLIK